MENFEIMYQEKLVTVVVYMSDEQVCFLVYTDPPVRLHMAIDENNAVCWLQDGEVTNTATALGELISESRDWKRC